MLGWGGGGRSPLEQNLISPDSYLYTPPVPGFALYNFFKPILFCYYSFLNEIIYCVLMRPKKLNLKTLIRINKLIGKILEMCFPGPCVPTQFPPWRYINYLPRPSQIFQARVRSTLSINHHVADFIIYTFFMSGFWQILNVLFDFGEYPTLKFRAERRRGFVEKTVCASA